MRPWTSAYYTNVHERGDRTQRADEEHRRVIRRSEDVAPGHEEHKHREDGGTAIEEAADLETARADHGTGVIGDLDQARAHDGNCGGDGAGYEDDMVVESAGDEHAGIWSRARPRSGRHCPALSAGATAPGPRRACPACGSASAASFPESFFLSLGRALGPRLRKGILELIRARPAEFENEIEVFG